MVSIFYKGVGTRVGVFNTVKRIMQEKNIPILRTNSTPLFLLLFAE